MDLMNEHYPIFLHRNIRCLRKRLNLSQEELAAKIGLNRGNIASYENGTAEPKICNLLKLSTLFGISITDLTQRDLGGDDTSTSEASERYEKFSNTELEVVQRFSERSEEIEQVFRGLHTCCRFRTNTMGELPKDVQILLSNFEQLYEAAQTLMCNHKALLEFIKSRIK